MKFHSGMSYVYIREVYLFAFETGFAGVFPDKSNAFAAYKETFLIIRQKASSRFGLVYQQYTAVVVGDHIVKHNSFAITECCRNMCVHILSGEFFFYGTHV